MFKTAKILARIARDRLGLEIRRAPRSTANRIRPAPPGRIVEFTGMPGVGKSHLMRRCIVALGPSFMTQEEIRLADNAADYESVVDPEIRALYEELIWRLLSQARERHASQVDLQQQIHSLRFMCNQLQSNMLVDAAYPIDALTDEGLVKNFSESLLELAESDNPGALKVLCRRHVILVEADPELTLSQIRERERDHNRPHPKYVGWSREEILRYYQENAPKYHARIEGLRPWTAGVLRISRSASTRQNVDAVAAFMQRSVSKGSE
ncbi:hypothetical protein [Pararhodobacter sp. SW119]|uniref:hypothetical protein n=1 Tax=Pararhodobacter sp. SW119 TaxID=2780075 RepID=UPI001AE0D133|nr:hypothetical protein [Pararhodobacter sp. SW119]